MTFANTLSLWRDEVVDVGSANDTAERWAASWFCHVPGLSMSVTRMDRTESIPLLVASVLLFSKNNQVGNQLSSFELKQHSKCCCLTCPGFLLTEIEMSQTVSWLILICMTHGHPGAGLQGSVSNVLLKMTFKRLNNASVMWRTKYFIHPHSHTETQMSASFQGKTHFCDYTKRWEQPDLSQDKTCKTLKMLDSS